MPRVTDTRQRLLDTSATLFRRRGYTATGLKQIASAGAAPIGSMYHFFPGGKEQLGAEAIARSGRRYDRLIDLVFERSADVADAITTWFRLASDALRRSDYADGCPIATVALEAASTSEPLRIACAAVFDSWLTKITDELVAAGHDPQRARALANFALASLEGAIVLARAGRSTEPLRLTGEVVAEAVRHSD